MYPERRQHNCSTTRLSRMLHSSFFLCWSVNQRTHRCNFLWYQAANCLDEEQALGVLHYQRGALENLRQSSSTLVIVDTEVSNHAASAGNKLCLKKKKRLQLRASDSMSC